MYCSLQPPRARSLGGSFRRFAILATILTTLAFSGNTRAQTWVNVGAADLSTHEADFDAMAISRSGTPYVVYSDFITAKAVVQKFDGTSWGLVGSGGVDTLVQGYTDIALDAHGTPYVSFSKGDDSGKIMVTKFDGTHWLTVGSPVGFTEDPAFSSHIALDSAGFPYVAYLEDSGCFVLPSIMKFDGTNWVHVGNRRFITGNVQALDMKIWNTTPYIAYQDLNDSGKVSVVKFNGTSWEFVGAEGFSNCAMATMALTISNGVPYVAFSDFTHSHKATVMKFDGTNWVYVGTPDFTRGGAENISIAIDASGTPYIGFADDSASHYAATVMKYNGTAWENVGPTGFTTTLAEYTSIAIDGAGTPYLCYQDVANGRKSSVMKYQPPANTEVNSVSAQPTVLNVFPNPCHGSFSLLVEGNESVARLMITDLTGRNIKELGIPTNKPTAIQLNVPTGTYIVTVVANGEKVNTTIVVE